jgi:hypothetical protein
VELFKAMVISFINTVIVLALCLIKMRIKRKVEVYGPFVYELDNSGNLEVVGAEAIPAELVETLRLKILNKFKPSDKSIHKLTIAILALTTFTIQLTVLLLV